MGIATRALRHDQIDRHGDTMLKHVLCLVSLILPSSLSAQDWWYGESDHFRVYSSGGEDAARKMAVELERVDQAMRLFTGTAVDESPLPENAKPTIFQFGETKDIGKLIGRDGVAGFFIPRAGDSVAFVPLEQGRRSRSRSSLGARTGVDYFDFDIDPAKVLYHEYAHYFMFQHAPAAYPPWYIEGLAELFGSLKLEEKGFSLGEPPEHRKGEISIVDVDTDQIFMPNDWETRGVRYPYYGHGWLLTSYLSFNPERQGQLPKFLRSLNAGVETREAARDAFGDLGVLEKELNKYRRQQARGMQAQFAELAEPAVTLRKLSPAEAARMLLYIESTKGVDQKEAKAVVGKARALAETYPSEPAVLRVLLEAEYDVSNLVRADAIARQLLETDYALDANLYLARIALRHAETDPSWLTAARRHYVAANRIENEHPEALSGYYATFRLAGEEPPEDALLALEVAYQLAPFDQGIRKALAHLFLLEGRDEAALNVLGPILFQPHGGKSARELRELVQKFKDGERQALIDELAPKLKDDA